MTDYGKLIVAIDVNTIEALTDMMDKLRAHVKIFKIGMEAYTSCGTGAIDVARRKGAKIFLDLKYHDIPNTVKGAARAAAKHGVHMLTVHASGGLAMMKAAKEGAEEEAAILKQERPLILGVTVLTSLEEEDLRDVGVKNKPHAQVIKLVKLAKKAGLDGIVCSPAEVEAVKRIVKDDMVIVVPGVRPSGSDRSDQKRIATPAEAIRAGADYLVVGRPITKADDPKAAAEEVIKEMKEGISGRTGKGDV